MISHGRLDWATPDELTPEQRELYELIVSGPRKDDTRAVELVDDSGRLEGPFTAMLVAPQLGYALQALGEAIRYRTTLQARAREIAILVVAAERRSSFEWYFHERVGRQCGLTEAELDAISGGEAAVSFSEHERAVFDAVTMLLRKRDIDDESFERFVTVLGQTKVMEVITLAGYYDLLALVMRVWRTPLPSGVDDPFESEADS